MQILYPLSEAAQLLGGISVWTLRKHLASGRIRVTRIGRRVFLDGEELERIRKEGLPSLRDESRTSPVSEEVSTPEGSRLPLDQEAAGGLTKPQRPVT